jgi:hypothetical protein
VQPERELHQLALRAADIERPGQEYDRRHVGLTSESHWRITASIE